MPIRAWLCWFAAKANLCPNSSNGSTWRLAKPCRMKSTRTKSTTLPQHRDPTLHTGRVHLQICGHDLPQSQASPICVNTARRRRLPCLIDQCSLVLGCTAFYPLDPFVAGDRSDSRKSPDVLTGLRVQKPSRPAPASFDVAVSAAYRYFDWSIKATIDCQICVIAEFPEAGVWGTTH